MFDCQSLENSMTQDEPEYLVGEEQESLETDVDILILEEDDLVCLTFMVGWMGDGWVVG